MSTPSDQSLNLALAKMLPDEIFPGDNFFYWTGSRSVLHRIQETEWLHVCWMVEQTLSNQSEKEDYQAALWKQDPRSKDLQRLWNQDEYSRSIWNCLTFASWQSRAIALAKVKGIDIN